MVLKANLKKSEQPLFETDGDEDEVAALAAAQEDEEAVEEPAPAAKPLAARLPTVRAGGALTSKVKAKFSPADFDLVGALKDTLPPVEFGEGVRLVASNGNLMDDDKKVLGASAKLILLSWNDRWVVSPGGESKDEEAKKLARYSMDGEVTTRGEPIEEYVEQLKKMGYHKAAVKSYIDLFGVLESAEKATEHVGKTVSVSLSPDSVKSFNGFRRDVTVNLMLGRTEQPEMSMGLPIVIKTDIKSSGGNSWTRLLFSL